MTTLTFDARDPHEITTSATHRRDYFTYCEHKLGRMSIFDPRRKNRTLDSSGFGQPASEVTQGAPKPAPKQKPEPEAGQDPDKLNLRPDEVTRLKALIQHIDQSAAPLSPTPTLGDRARQDAKEALENAREDHRLPEWKKSKKAEATHDTANAYKKLGHDLYS